MTTTTVTNAPPSVHFVFASTDLLTGTNTITLVRTVDGVYSNVRSAVNVFANGGWVGDDWEIPPGVAVSYSAIMFDSSGNQLGVTSPIVITVPSTGAGVAWISDPLDQTSAVQILMANTAGQSPSRPMLGNLYQVGLRTVALVQKQSLLTSLVMDFYTFSDTDRAQVQNMLTNSGGLLLLRTPPPMMVSRMLYFWAQNTTPAEYNLVQGIPRVKWANTVNEISAPEGNPVVVTVSYQTYMDAFSTYALAEAAYSTYFDAMKNPPA